MKNCGYNVRFECEGPRHIQTESLWKEPGIDNHQARELSGIIEKCGVVHRIKVGLDHVY
jgi:hypothetical protein